MSYNDRLKGEWSLRVARRWLDPDTVARVVEPAIEDLRHEAAAAHGTARVHFVVTRAYWGLWKAIVACVVGEMVTVARPTLDGIVFRMAVGLPLIMALLMALVVNGSFSRPPHEGWLLLLLSTAPQAFVFALPVAYFFAVILDRQPSPPLRVLPAIVGASTACTVIALIATFVLVPMTSQVYRQTVFEQQRVADAQQRLERGPGEMTFFELVDKARSERTEEAPARRRLYSGLALSALPLVLGIVGFGVADPRMKGGIALFSGFWVLMFYAGALRSVAGSVTTPPSASGLALVDAGFVLGGLWMTWLRSRTVDSDASGPRFGVPNRL
jgi:hypothetical protein